MASRKIKIKHRRSVDSGHLPLRLRVVFSDSKRQEVCLDQTPLRSPLKRLPLHLLLRLLLLLRYLDRIPVHLLHNPLLCSVTSQLQLARVFLERPQLVSLLEVCLEPNRLQVVQACLETLLPLPHRLEQACLAIPLVQHPQPTLQQMAPDYSGPAQVNPVQAELVCLETPQTLRVPQETRVYLGNHQLLEQLLEQVYSGPLPLQLVQAC